MSAIISQAEILKQARELQSQTAEKVLEWAFKTFDDRMALASSFQAEESVLIHLMCQIAGRKARVFTLDTGRLNQETYDCMDALREKYGISIEVYFPDAGAVEKMVRSQGLNLFYHSIENRKLCCGIRKVEPLKRALAGLDAWLTGLRRGQAVTRREIPKLEWDDAHGLAKINPLADWSREQVWEFIRAHKLPYNKLYDQGYAQIGCAPCTRAIRPGEDERAGRWWWESPEQKECGLHIKTSGRAAS